METLLHKEANVLEGNLSETTKANHTQHKLLRRDYLHATQVAAVYVMGHITPPSQAHQYT